MLKKTKRATRRVPYKSPPPPPPEGSGVRAHAVPTSAFVLREDGTIVSTEDAPAVKQPGSAPPSPPQLIYRDDARSLWLYHGNSLELLDAIAAKYPEGLFDCIFADPPYFLSNGGITCHAGRLVKVDKGDWDKSRGPEINHEFNLEWLPRCQRVLKPNGTIWVTGTLHVIFSIGYAMQQLGFKILNDIAWEKPNPPPNLSCRYFTHSIETVLWAAKSEKAKHTFNYHEMRKVTGKQMKTVWRRDEFQRDPADLDSVWTMSAPGSDEKVFGKRPTQKPVALIERCLLASTGEGDLVLDPFLGGGTTAVVSVRLHRGFVGIEFEWNHAALASRRTDHEIITFWLRELRVRFEAAIFLQKDLDPDGRSMDRIGWMKDDDPKTDCIFHETKFVFLSCAVVSSASVVHTTVDVSLQEAWANAPNAKKRETTHIVRCQTEIFRVDLKNEV